MSVLLKCMMTRSGLTHVLGHTLWQISEHHLLKGVTWLRGYYANISPKGILYICNGGQRVGAVHVNLTPLISRDTLVIDSSGPARSRRVGPVIYIHIYIHAEVFYTAGHLCMLVNTPCYMHKLQKDITSACDIHSVTWICFNRQGDYSYLHLKNLYLLNI